MRTLHVTLSLSLGGEEERKKGGGGGGGRRRERRRRRRREREVGGGGGYSVIGVPGRSNNTSYWDAFQSSERCLSNSFSTPSW